MDTVIQVDKEHSIIRTTKQRDGKLLTFDYRLAPLWLGFDDDGDDLESCTFERLVIDNATSVDDLL